MEERLENPEQQENIEDEFIEAELTEEETTEVEKPAALTLVIQSWATPIVGVIMLVIGLFGGYFVRPLISTGLDPVAVEESTTADQGTVPATIPTTDPERAAQQQEVMNAVIERTRHFRGDPDAPVTIIEFSDFQ